MATLGKKLTFKVAFKFWVIPFVSSIWFLPDFLIKRINVEKLVDFYLVDRLKPLT